MKDFEAWNVQKQAIHFLGKEKLYHARDGGVHSVLMSRLSKMEREMNTND